MIARKPQPSLLLSLCAFIAMLISQPVNAQTSFTWEQIKTKFEAANPTLQADETNVQEMKANEITADLRPNPQFTLSQDGTQLAPNDGVWKPLSGTYVVPSISYQSELRAAARMMIIVPLTVLLIFIILYSMYKSLKWALLILATVAMATIGGLLVLLITHTNFSVSSEVGFLALFGVSVQTGVIMLEYINQLRARGHSIEESAVEGAVLRLRPIMMTMLVATLGLLPAAMSHSIGSDSQRPFAIVIVGGLVADLVMSIFLLPTLYVWLARPSDVLPTPETEFEN
jgi:multidrug efflux pump subunit AcrB